MTQSDLMAQAKQGNPNAIATLLNRALEAKGIRTCVTLDGNCLSVELTSAQSIPQQSAIQFIWQGMNRLQPRRIHTVLVSAKTTGDRELEWMESFSLDDVDAVSTVADLAPDVAPLKQLDAVTPVPEKSVSSLRVKPTVTGARTLRATQSQRASTSAKGIEALLIGLVLAIVLFNVGFFKVLFHGALILVHEVGHAITHWAFGRPAIPTVNLLYGGGVTLTFGQIWLLNGVIYLGIAYLVYRLRNYPQWQGVVGLLTLLYTYCLLTSTNRMLSVLMGHGLEVVAIAVCLFLAATGYFCRIPGDRAIYAMLGFFILFSDVEFAWKLMHDADFRDWYEGGIGGVIDNDFVILANEYFQVNLSQVASIFMASCFFAAVVGLALPFFMVKQIRRK